MGTVTEPATAEFIGWYPAGAPALRLRIEAPEAVDQPPPALLRVGTRFFGVVLPEALETVREAEASAVGAKKNPAIGAKAPNIPAATFHRTALGGWKIPRQKKRTIAQQSGRLGWMNLGSDQLLFAWARQPCMI
jgi:hypothetical protein